MMTEQNGLEPWDAKIGTALARLLRPDVHPVMRLLEDQPLTVQDVLGRLDPTLPESVDRDLSDETAAARIFRMKRQDDWAPADQAPPSQTQ